MTDGAKRVVARPMSRELETLLAVARGQPPTPSEQEAQVRSFAYGNLKLEEPNLTRSTIDRAADASAEACVLAEAPVRESFP